MITGSVNKHYEAIVHLVVGGPQGQVEEIEAIIDTGFSGWLSLPTATIAQLGLPFRRRGRAFLADGSESIFDIYEGTVVWNGQMQRTPIDEADTAPLIGMQMLTGYELNIEVVTGGQVTVKLLP